MVRSVFYGGKDTGLRLTYGWRIYDRVATRRYNWKLISLNDSPISSVTVNLMTITAAVIRSAVLRSRRYLVPQEPDDDYPIIFI